MPVRPVSFYLCQIYQKVEQLNKIPPKGEKLFFYCELFLRQGRGKSVDLLSTQIQSTVIPIKTVTKYCITTAGINIEHY